MIVSVTPCPGAATNSCAYNVNRATLEGFTLGSDTRIGNLNLRASADFQDPRDDTTGKQLQRRAKRHASVAADYEIGPVAVGAELQGSGERFDDAANTRRLGGYGLLNLYTSWHVSRDWSLLLRVENVADKRYELARNYRTTGQTWFAALRYGIR
jgi:vitamin B12 transporter